LLKNACDLAIGSRSAGRCSEAQSNLTEVGSGVELSRLAAPSWCCLLSRNYR